MACSSPLAYRVNKVHPTDIAFPLRVCTSAHAILLPSPPPPSAGAFSYFPYIPCFRPLSVDHSPICRVQEHTFRSLKIRPRSWTRPPVLDRQSSTDSPRPTVLGRHTRTMAGLFSKSRSNEKGGESPPPQEVTAGDESTEEGIVDEAKDDLHRGMKPRQLSALS